MAKHSRKSILAIVLTLCAALCLGIFAACNDDDGNTAPTDQPVTYTVTVMQDATTPAAGVKVTVKKGSAAFAPKTTGADGKVTFELVPDDYEITLTSIPDHYTAPSGLALTKDNQNVTFTLERKPLYTVKLVNPDNSPYYADGVMVGVCDAESCRAPVALNEQGVAVIEEEKGEYHVQIQGLPKDRAYKWISSSAANYYSEEEFKNEVTEMTIVIYPVTVIETVTPMTDAEKTAYTDEKGWSFKSGSTAYKVSATIPAGESAYYSITPSRSGKYTLYKTDEYYSKWSWLQYGTNFANNGNQNFFPVMEADKTYYLGVHNTDEENDNEVEFVIEAPVSSYHEVTSAQDLSVRVDNADAYAVIEFKPTEAGAYKATAQGNQTAIKTVNGLMLDYVTFEDDEYDENSACNIRFTNDKLGDTVYIVVSAKSGGNNYPASFTVKLEKTHALEDTTTVVAVEEELKKFGEQAGKELIPVELDGSDTIYYDEENGYYRLGDENDKKADDPIVVVLLTKDLDPDRFYLDKARTLVYLEMATNGRIAPYVFDVTEDKESLEKGNDYIDYRAMLRGFAEYTKTPSKDGFTLSVPDKMDVEEYYANYVNSDGVYPLTKELKEYLEWFVEYANEYAYNNQGRLLIPDGEENWMFACYYYGVGLTDDIIGEYEDEDGNTLTVKSNGRFILTIENEVFGGKWSKNEDDEFYSFKESAAFMAGAYSVELKEDGSLEFCYDPADYRYDENDPFAVAMTFSVPDPNKAKAIYKLTTMGDNYSNAKLELFDDNTFKLSTGRFDVELSADGTYEMKDGSLTISVSHKYADSLTDVTATYKDGVITVVLTYTYEAEEEGGEDIVVKVTYAFTLDEE